MLLHVTSKIITLQLILSKTWRAFYPYHRYIFLLCNHRPRKFYLALKMFHFLWILSDVYWFFWRFVIFTYFLVMQTFCLHETYTATFLCTYSVIVYKLYHDIKKMKSSYSIVLFAVWRFVSSLNVSLCYQSTFSIWKRLSSTSRSEAGLCIRNQSPMLSNVRSVFGWVTKSSYYNWGSVDMKLTTTQPCQRLSPGLKSLTLRLATRPKQTYCLKNIDIPNLITYSFIFINKQTLSSSTVEKTATSRTFQLSHG